MVHIWRVRCVLLALGEMPDYFPKRQWVSLSVRSKTDVLTHVPALHFIFHFCSHHGAKWQLIVVLIFISLSNYAEYILCTWLTVYLSLALFAVRMWNVLCLEMIPLEIIDESVLIRYKDLYSGSSGNLSSGNLSINALFCLNMKLYWH